MKIHYNVVTQTATVDVTPQELGQITPEAVKGIVRMVIDAIKDVRATLPILDWRKAVEP